MRAKGILTLLAVAALTTVSQAAVITGFTNLDFDDNTQDVFPKGFDGANGSYDVPGWQDLHPGAVNDAGCQYSAVNEAGEKIGAWWLTYDKYTAFMATGDGAYNTSTYAIQAGDAFEVDFYAARWGWTGAGAWTVSLFYNDPSNVFGTYVQSDVSDWNYTAYKSPVFTATPESVGGLLGVIFESTGGGIAQLDEVTVNAVPEPASMSLIGLGALAMLRKRR